jgi:tetratricopeptide (TPR) repeat protein
VPRLNEIANKYAGKVNVVGVNVWEDRNAKDNSFHAKVESYASDMGLQYLVAADGYEGKVAKAWMEASGSNGIPTSFIVGKDGTVLWVGHPMAGMDEAIQQILDGKYDMEAAKAKDEARRKAAAERRAASAAMAKVIAPITEAYRAGDVAKAIQLLDAAIAENPKMAVNLSMTKFNYLIRSDEAKAQEWALEMSRGIAKDNAQLLNTLAWTIVDDKGPIKKPNAAIAVQIAERAVAIVPENEPFAPYVIDTLAYALYKDGKLDRALECQSKAVALAENVKGLNPETLKEMKERLEEFKKKKGGG